MRMKDSILNYIENKKQPGQFLTAIITNSLKEAVAHADEENCKNIPAYVGYFCNEAPMACWGSEKIMNNWLKTNKEFSY